MPAVPPWTPPAPCVAGPGRQAKQVLEFSYDVPDSVKVTVEDGWITLHGEVDWNHQKEAAERKVRDITGVKAS